MAQPELKATVLVRNSHFHAQADEVAFHTVQEQGQNFRCVVELGLPSCSLASCSAVVVVEDSTIDGFMSDELGHRVLPESHFLQR